MSISSTFSVFQWPQKELELQDLIQNQEYKHSLDRKSHKTQRQKLEWLSFSILFLKILIFFLNSLYVYIYVYEYVQVNVGSYVGKKQVLGPWS